MTKSEFYKKLEIFMMIFIAICLLFTVYKIGEMNGRIQGMNRAIEIVEG